MNTKKETQRDKRMVDTMRDIRDHLNVKLSVMTPEQRTAYINKQVKKAESKR